MRCTPELRQQAITLGADVGPAEAARRLGLNANTVRSWLNRAGVIAHATTVATKAPEVALRIVTIAERKAELAQKLADAAVRMADELFSATVEKRAIAAGLMREVEIVEIEHTTTTAAERRTTAQAIDTLVGTVQLLTGEATERIEQITNQPPQVRAKAVVDELERRRSEKGAA